MTTYLCTCGTSAANNLQREERLGPAWVAAQGGIAPATPRLPGTFAAYWMASDLALHCTIPAEVQWLRTAPGTGREPNLMERQERGYAVELGVVQIRFSARESAA